VKSIFIAAGIGSRLRPYTDDCPKCMLPLDGRPVLSNNVENLRAHGVDDVSIVVGYMKDRVTVEDARRFENTDYENNNILFSLMYASSIFEDAISADHDLVISYSDIIYSSEIVSQLVSHSEDIVIAVDLDWRSQYEGRTEHPMSEAEKVELDDRDRAIRLGKVVPNESDRRIGEFTGLLKLTPAGARQWLEHFEQTREKLDPLEPFQNAAEFRKAYLTDFLQDLVDNGIDVTCSTFSGGWMEFDTTQDYEKLLATWTAKGRSGG
jgi:choline kinase